MNTRLFPFLLLLFSIALQSCKEDKKSTKDEGLEAFDSPQLNVDTIYSHIETQLAFGHRVPGTDGHVACKNWLQGKLRSYTPNVVVQEFPATFLTVQNAPAYNIIASFNPQAPKRILLGAHWDSRLIAEKDTDPALMNQPIMGADDGASGTAMLLEIARMLKEKPLTYYGVDIVLFDAEDQGSGGEGWCLGSKYWSRNPHVENYYAEFGVLLDMIGAEGAQFGYEGYSKANAALPMNKIWDLAEYLGYGDLFVRKDVGGIEDDHYYVIANRGIPMVDIINRPLQTPSGFGHYHHTHEDDIDIISKEVLGKVAHVMSQLIYRTENQQI